MADGSLLFDTKVDTKGVEQGMSQVGNIAKGALAADLIKASAQAVGNLGKAAIDVGKNFETSMSQVAATMGITSEEIANGSKEFDMLEAKAKEMGATTKYTASEAAEGLNILAMAGLSAEDACAGIGDVMALAGAGAMSLEQSATYVTGAVKGFNDSMENASKYTDIMAKGATMANTDVKGLGEALSRVSSNATAYNQSVESTSVALLRLAEQNVTGAEAATSLSRVMADLYTPTDKAAAALEKLGIETYDEAGNARDLNDVVDELNDRLSEMSDEEKLAYESTIFTTFGMKGFQKMTVSTTDTVKKFKEGINEAAGSAMQQFETQTDNLEGKLAILNSALEATGIAIYEIFGDELKDAVSGTTEVVDRLHESIENGALHDSFEHLAEAFGDFIESALELGEKALPVIIDGLAFLVDNIGPLITGFLTYQAVTKGYEIVTLAAASAQEVLNGAMLANPIGLAAAAIAGAVGLITMAVNEQKEAQRELEEIAESTVKVTEKVDGLTKKMGGTLEELKNKGTYIKVLATELKSLNSLNQLDLSQKSRIAEITSLLNAEYGDLNLQIDETTGKLKEECQGWDNLLESRMKQSQYTAISDMLTESMNAQAEAEFELWQNEQKLADARSEREALERDLVAESQKLHENESDYQAYLNETYNRISDLEKQEQILKDTHGELEEKTNSLKSTTFELEEYMGTLGEEVLNTAEVDQAAIEATNELTEAEQEAAAAAEEEAEALQKAKESLESTVESQVASFEKIKEASALSKDEVLKNLQSNVDAMNNWADNMNTLAARGIDDGLLMHLAEMGPQGAAQVQEFVKMTGAELEQAGDLWREAMGAEKFTDSLAEEYMTAGQTITQQYIDGAWEVIPEFEAVPTEMVNTFVGSAEWNRMPDEVKKKVYDAMTAAKDEVSSNSTDLYDASSQSAEQIPKGMVDATKKGTDQVKVASKELGDNAIDSLAEGAGESSPGGDSTTAHKIGESVSDSLAEGMESRTENVKTQAKAVSDAALKTIDGTLTKDTFTDIGRRIPEGLAAGIRSGLDDVRAAASEAATAAEVSTKTKLKTNSPSKVFEEIGQMCVAGFERGLNGDTTNLSLGSVLQDSMTNITIKGQQQEPQPVIIESHVHLDADAQRVFRMVSTENKRIYEITGQNELNPSLA